MLKSDDSQPGFDDPEWGLESPVVYKKMRRFYCLKELMGGRIGMMPSSMSLFSNRGFCVLIHRE
jgi:hypothetical protein